MYDVRKDKGRSMIYKILIEDARTGGLVTITSEGADEKEAEDNIIKYYPKARKDDYKVKAMLTEDSFNKLIKMGLIE
jgi:hypothetical protein